MPTENAQWYDELDANNPLGPASAGEGDDHLRMLKVVHTNTWTGTVGDRYDSTGGAVLVGPVALNRLPTDVSNIATEIGLDLDNITATTRIDTLETDTVKNNVPQTISEDWTFTGTLDFQGAANYSGPRPTIISVDIATVADIPTKRTTNQLNTINFAGNKTVIDSEYGDCLNYTGAGGHTLTIDAAAPGVADDLLFVRNSGAGILTVSSTGAGSFLDRYGNSTTSFTITDKTKTAGLHKYGGNFAITGDYD